MMQIPAFRSLFEAISYIDSQTYQISQLKAQNTLLLAIRDAAETYLKTGMAQSSLSKALSAYDLTQSE